MNYLLWSRVQVVVEMDTCLSPGDHVRYLFCASSPLPPARPRVVPEMVTRAQSSVHVFLTLLALGPVARWATTVDPA